MRRTFAWGIAVVVGLLIGSGLSCAETRERTGPDAFLKYRVSDLDTYLAELQRDPVLQKRLAKHFHVPQAQLVSYFRTHLRVVSCPNSGWHDVYGVTKQGRIYRARDFFRKGTKVLGLADGTPILRIPCGNPMTNRLPPEKPGAPPETSVPHEQSQAAPAAPAVAPELPSVTAPEEYAALTEAPAADSFEVSPTTEHRKKVVVPPLIWIPRGGGGDSDGRKPDGPRPELPVVPEPGTLLLLASGGGAALVGKLLWRRRG